jgi:hypothetical protein
MPARTPEERAMVARIAAAGRWDAVKDRTEATQPMRDARRAKLAGEITAQLGELPPAELERHIDYRIRQHMLRMALRSSQSRRRARENLADAQAAEAELASLSREAAS